MLLKMALNYLSCLNNSMISNLKNKKTRISNKSEWIWNLLFIGREVKINENAMGTIQILRKVRRYQRGVIY
jgi:hypothetical protein